MGWRDTIAEAKPSGGWRDTVKPIVSAADEDNSAEAIMKKVYQPSQVASFGVGGLQGMLFNAGDEALGRLSALKEIATTDKTLSDYDDLVKQEVQTAREAFGHAEKANPTAYVGGELTSALAQSALPVLNATKGALAARFAKGAGMGAASAIGGSEKSGAERLKDAPTGLLAGAAGQALGEGGKKAFQSFGTRAGKGLLSAAETLKNIPKGTFIAPLATGVAVGALSGDESKVKNAIQAGVVTALANMTRNQQVKSIQKLGGLLAGKPDPFTGAIKQNILDKGGDVAAGLLQRLGARSGATRLTENQKK